jgi:hypothetical protein
MTGDAPLSYPDTLATFEKLVCVAISFSDASGGIYTSNLGIEATKVYTRLTLSAMTINALLPGNCINRTKLWDFPSVATLTRTFLETCHRYLYLAEAGLSPDESEFRLKLFYYHMNSEKYRLYKEMSARHETLQDFESRLPTARAEIEASPVYAALHKHRADKVRSGHTEMHLTDEEVAARSNLAGGRFKSIYRLLSNHSHGSPFATFSQSNTRGRGVENDVERDYMTLSITLLDQYLSTVIVRQVQLLSLEPTHPEGYEFAKQTMVLR